MAWFLNFYKCARCKRRWTDEWSCMCDDECPHCGARDMSPYDSEELTTLIEEDGKEFIVFWSPETAEHDPDYRELGRFPSREKALEFLSPTDEHSRHSGMRRLAQARNPYARSWLGIPGSRRACHRAALCADPLARPGMTT